MAPWGDFACELITYHVAMAFLVSPVLLKNRANTGVMNVAPTDNDKIACTLLTPACWARASFQKPIP